MGKVKVFVVEDDIIHMNRMEMVLDEIGYELAGSTDNGDEAMRKIAAVKPDVILLDIEINGSKSGLDILRELNEKDPTPSIITSSHHDPSTLEEAKKIQPLAYLVKPISQGSLQAAIEMALYKFSHNTDILKPQETKTESTDWHKEDQLLKNSIFLKSAGKLTKLKIGEIRYIEVQDKNCLIGIEKDILKVRIPLHKMEKKLGETNFLRVHRSFIINSDYISEINISDNTVRLEEYHIPIGRAYRESLINNLDTLSD